MISLLLACCPLPAAESADLILSARWVVTMDAERRMIDDGAVAVRGERIVAVGTRPVIDARYTAKQRIDAGRSILAPGLINTHTHAAMSLLRGVGDDLTLQDWLEKFIFPAEAKNVSAEFVRDGTLLACTEMLLSGTTTFTDMYYFEEVVAEATKQCGMRGVLGQTIIGFPVPDAKTPAEGLRRAEAFVQKYANDPLIVPAVAPHALYTNDETTLRAARALADRYQVPLITHVSETKKENDDTVSKFGVSPTEQLESWGILRGRTLVAHGVWLSPRDIGILAKQGTGVAHCPSSNMKLASGVAPVMGLLAAKVPTGLGTDGPASNNDLNMFEEMDLASKLQKVQSRDPAVLPAAEVFTMATIGGARALGMDKTIGSIEAGKHADLIVVGAGAPHATPLFNVYSHLVYALKGSDVTNVVVNGRVVVRNRRLMRLDAPRIAFKARQWRARISRSLAAPTP